MCREKINRTEVSTSNGEICTGQSTKLSAFKKPNIATSLESVGAKIQFVALHVRPDLVGISQLSKKKSHMPTWDVYRKVEQMID